MRKKISIKENEIEAQTSSINMIIRKLFKEKNKFKKSKIQNAKYEDNVVKDHMKLLISGEDAIAFFAKYGNTTPIKFIHCVKDEKFAKNPYKLRIVHDHNDLTKVQEYYTVSPSGIVHIYSNSLIDKKTNAIQKQPTEFISLSDWMRESTEFNILSNIHFFKNFQSTKVFKTWRVNQKKMYFNSVRNMIVKDVFYCKPAYSKSIFDIKIQLSLIFQKEIVNFSHWNQKPVEYEDFKTHQKDTRTSVYKQFEIIFEDILNVIQNVAQKIEQAKTENDRLNQKHNFVSDLVKQKPLNLIKREKQEKKLRKKLSEYDYNILGKFVRFINYLTLENLIEVNNNSVNKLKEELFKDRKNGLFITSPLLSEISVNFVHKDEDIKNAIEQIFEENIKVLKDLPKILGHNSFDTYIKNILDEGQSTDCITPNLKEIIKNSREFNEKRELIHTKIKKDFEEAKIKVEANFNQCRRIENERKNFKIEDWIAKNPSLEEIKAKLMLMKEYKKESQERIKDYFHGILHVDSQSIRNQLNAFIDECNQKIIEQLYQYTKKEVEQTSEEFNTFNKSITIEVKTLQNYTDLIKNTRDVNQKLEEISNKKSQIEKMQKLLKQVNYETPRNDRDNINQIMKISSIIEGNLKTAQNVIETQKDHFQEKVHEMEEQIKEEASKIQYLINSEDYRKIETPIIEALRKLKFIKEKVSKLEQMYKIIEGHIKLMQIKLSEDLEPFEEIQISFQEIYTLWKKYDQFQKKYEDWFESNFKKLDIKEYENSIKQFASYCEDHRKSTNVVMKHLISQIDETIDLIPCVTVLGNVNLKEKHWEQILKNFIGGPSLLNKGSFSLKELLALGVTQQMILINEISSKATEEEVIRQGLNTIKKEWFEQNLCFSNYREFQDKYILTDEISEILEKLDTDLLKIQSMMGSKFVKEIKEELEEWEKKLLIFQQTLEEWLQLQKQWMYLENIFSSADIKKQLPNENLLFTNVDKFWKDTMNNLLKKPAIKDNIIDNHLFNQFKEANKQMDKIQKNLEDYLDMKRNLFPRFFFLSNDELLEIFSQTTNPEAVQPHLRKCFDNIKKIKFLEKHGEKQDVEAMISAEPENDPEIVYFKEIVKIQGPVEEWLLQIENMMRESLYDSMNKCFEEATKFKGLLDESLFFKYPSQIVLAVNMILWTFGIQKSIQKNQLPKFLILMQTKIQVLVELIKKDLKPGERELIKCLMVLDVHNRDVAKTLSELHFLQIHDFNWKKILRYYWEKNEEYKEKKIDCIIKQTNTNLLYGYEYLGNSSRLVITPLTDKCYLTLTTALSLNYGGAPAGPAGTGKTETTKDLGKAVAVICIVFNCSDSIVHETMGRFFSGLAQCGAWACFDEFNRIEIEVLSVIAQQILIIQNAVKEKRKEFDFEGKWIKLNGRFGVFITMNPGYAGRTELPDNLKALFRPVAMMIPDYSLIAEIILFSEGFLSANILARKMVALYKLSSEQLSKQKHYDFGMRAVKSVLTMAGSLRRQNPDLSENVVLLKAMKDSNLPKFAENDIPLFQGIIKDLFPSLVVEDQENKELQQNVKEYLESQNLQSPIEFIKKCCQLYEVSTVRHGIMIVGKAGTGKTKIIEGTCNGLKKQGDLIKLYKLNPKSLTQKELFGYSDPITNSFIHGMVSKIITAALEIKNQNKKWFIFDGPVDADWIENLNTVLDDNKMLCLPDGKRIKLPTYFSMIFEVEDLEQASPATVSRCGMIYLDKDNLDPFLHFESWKIILLKKLNEKQKEFDMILIAFEILKSEQFFMKIKNSSQQSLDFIRKNCNEVIETINLNLLQNCLDLFEISILQFLENLQKKCQSIKDKKSREIFLKELEIEEQFFAIFIFASTWSFGGNLKKESKVVFSKMLKIDIVKNTKLFKECLSIYDFFYDYENQQISYWKNLIDKYTYNQNTPYFKILIQTQESVSTQKLLKILLYEQKNVFINGNSGVGKTLIINSFLNSLDEEHLSNNAVFSAQTTAKNLYSIFLDKYINKGKDLYPSGGKKMIFFIDDINMPKLDTYGAQPVNELLRQIIDQGGFYDLKKYLLKYIKNTTFVGSCAPPNGGRNELPKRLIRHFHMLNLDDLSESSMELIYHSILNGFLLQSETTKKLEKDGLKIVQCSIKLYEQISEALLPIPIKCHYTFNLRDLSKVFQGMLQIKQDLVKNNDDLIELWIHEECRIFRDRLINEEDRRWFQQALKEICMKFLNYTLNTKNYDKKIYSDIFEKQYKKVENEEELVKVLLEGVKKYNLKKGSNENLVMFSYAVQHLCRIKRVLSMPRGNMVLIGLGGSGKQSLTKIASFLNNQEYYTIEIKKKYFEPQWREDIKKLLNIFISEEDEKTEGVSFMLTSNQILQDTFLEDINNLLNCGEIPNLYQIEEIEDLLSKIRETAKRKNQIFNSKEELWNFFVELVRNRLHIILTFSPVGDSFRNKCRQFPSIINCSTIDWFDKWSEEALYQVGIKKLSENQQLELNEEIIQKIAKIALKINKNVEENIETFYNELRRKCYVTPSNFLDFTQLYTKLYKREKETLPLKIKKYKEGLQKMKETKEIIEILKQKIIENQPKIEQAKNDNEILKQNLEEQNKIAKEKESAVEIEAKDITQTRNEVQEMRQNCQKDLDEALPALYKAQEAARNIDKSYIATIKTYNVVAKDIKMVLFALNLIFGRKENWEEVKKFLGEMDFLKKLTNLDPMTVSQKTWTKLKKNYLDLPEFNVQNLKEKISEAISTLANYCINMEIYYQKKLIVEPKEKKLAIAEEKLTVVEEKMNKKYQELEEIQSKVQQLSQKLTESIQKEQNLNDQQELAKIQLKRAEKLIIGLKDEADRWEEISQKLLIQEQNTQGNILITSASVAYIGPFFSSYRKNMMQKWIEFTKNEKITISENFSLKEIIGDPMTIREWQLNGLPGDDLSTENALLLQNSLKWPLMIDPQTQANKWLKQSKKDQGLICIKPNNPNLLQIMENAVKYGNTILLENVGEKLDSSLDTVLMKEFRKSGGQIVLKLNDNEVPYNKDFSLQITTKLQNPHYLPETTIKVNIINFTVTEKGLEDQLLGEVVKIEKPELEEQKSILIKQISDDNKQLYEIQERILKLIVQSSGNLLDNEELIETLEASEKTTLAINERVVKAKETNQEINESRNKYLPIAEQGSVIYFVICNLPNIDPIYEFSLDYFINFFNKKIRQNENFKNDIPKRVKNLQGELTEKIFKDICRGIFEEHKLLFVFMLAVKIQMKKKLISQKQWEFFKIFETDIKNQNTKPQFLSQRAWNLFAKIQQLSPNLTSISNQFDNFPNEFQNIINEEEISFNNLVFLPQANFLNAFDKLLILRILREEKLEFLITEFIKNTLGENYLDFPNFDLKQAYLDSSIYTPIILILSSGADPSNNFRALSSEFEMDNQKTKSISLGQGQGEKAKETIKIAQLNGDWVCLKNCHLAVKWLPELELILENTSQDCHQDYRLFLTTMPTDKFPVNFLHQSVKITNEPPKGIRANLRRIYNEIDEDWYEECTKPQILKPLLFCLSIFHTIILERRKFGSIGWNIPYQWMTSDLTASQEQLKMYIEQSKDVPFESLSYIIGMINYGGRITDYNDEKLVLSLLKSFFNLQCLEKGYVFLNEQIKNEIYKVPETKNKENVLEYIKNLPFIDEPDIFGLHQNTKINMDLQNAKLMSDLFMQFEPSNLGGGDNGTNNQQILNLIEDFKQKLPNIIPLGKTQQRDSLLIFRDQESQRFNHLLKIIKNSLLNLENSIKGFSVMSEQFEKMYKKIDQLQVPELWSENGFLSEKKLTSWFDDLILRINFFKEWQQNPDIPVHLIGSFFFPQGFITAVLQNYSRKMKMAIDSLIIQTNVLTRYAEHFNEKKPENGVYIAGLLIENASYNLSVKGLVDPKPKVLLQELPVIWLLPVNIQELVEDQGFFQCPVYKTSLRRGELSTTGHSTNFVMYLDMPLAKGFEVDHWVRRGTAILLQSDN